MNIKLRSNYTSHPETIMAIEQEEIARQVIGQRLTFSSRHDVTFQFANGSATMDDIELIIYIMPNQFFCYRGDDVITTIVLEGEFFDVDLRAPINGTNGRAFIRIAAGK